MSIGRNLGTYSGSGLMIRNPMLELGLRRMGELETFCTITDAACLETFDEIRSNLSLPVTTWSNYD